MKEAGDGKDKYEFSQLEKGVFETIDRLLEGDDIDSVPDIEGRFLSLLMAGIEYLDLPEDGVSEVCRNLAGKSLGGMHVRAILRSKMSDFGAPSISAAAYLGLLRAYADMCNTHVLVERETVSVRSGKNDKLESSEGASEIKDVVVTPLAFDNLLERREGRTCPAYTDPGADAGSSEGEVNGWDVFTWILMHMEIGRLNLNKCRMSKDHIAPISKLTALRILTLEYCDISQINLTPLSTLAGLEELDVSRNRLSAGAIQGISKLAGLRVLSLTYYCGNPVDFAPLSALGRLEELDASGSELDSRAIQEISKLVGLLKLKLKDCELPGIDELSALEWRSDRMPPKVDFVPLSALNRLKELDVSGCFLNSDAIQGISGLVGLIKLVMHDCKLLSFNLTPLSAMSSLQELEISGNKLNNDAIKAISEIVGLVRLCIRKCHLHGLNITPLGDLKYLRELDVSENALYNSNILAISEFVGLTKLLMLHCNLRKVYLAPLSNMRNLKELDVNYNFLRAGAVPKIASLTAISPEHLYQE